MTSYTEGIYCIHGFVSFYFIKLFKINQTFFSCLCLYIICYIISCFGKNIFKDNKMKYSTYFFLYVLKKIIF